MVTVLVGELEAARSPARHDTPLLGADLTLHGDTTVPLRPEWEHALVVLEGDLGIDGQRLQPGKLGYLGQGRDEVRLEVRERTTAILLGGEPFPDPIVMWWNFVARSRDEIDAAYRAWDRQGDRFGRLESPLPRIPARAPSWHRG